MRVLSIVLLSPALALVAPALKGNQAYYHATTVGDTLVYETKIGDDTMVLTIVVDKVEEKEDGLIVHSRGSMGPDSKRVPYKHRISDQGVFRLAVANKEYATPMTLLKLPAKVGDTWENKIEGIKIGHECKLIGEE
jgi:hypothetical protein